MINGIHSRISNNKAEVETKLIRPTTISIATKSEALTGVTIKQVKEMLHSEDISQVVKLFALMTSRDLHLAGALSSRRDQLQSLPYTIEGDAEVVKFATAYLESTESALLIQNYSSALEYGFCVLDLSWGVVDINAKNYFVPLKQKLLSARYFSYDDKKPSDDQALYLSVKDKKKYLSSYDTRKILLHLHPTDTEHITKYSPLYKAAWFIALKHQVIASNMQWFDALGVPPLIINQDTADEKDLESVLYQALSLRSNAVGIFPKGVDAKLLTEGVGSKSDFLSFIEYIDKQVSFFVTGQTLATGSSATGSYAQAKIHENRLSEKQAFDAKLIGGSITHLLNLIISQNFPTPKRVRFAFTIKPQINLKESSEVIKNLESAGFEIPAIHIESQFGIQGIKRKSATPIAHNTQYHTEHNATVGRGVLSPTIPWDKTQSEIQKLDLNAVEEGLNSRLIAAISASNSYEEVYELLAADESVDVDELEKLLVQTIANAQMQGVDDV